MHPIAHPDSYGEQHRALYIEVLYGYFWSSFRILLLYHRVLYSLTESYKSPQPVIRTWVCMFQKSKSGEIYVTNAMNTTEWSKETLHFSKLLFLKKGKTSPNYIQVFTKINMEI